MHVPVAFFRVMLGNGLLLNCARIGYMCTWVCTVHTWRLQEIERTFAVIVDVLTLRI